MVPHWSHILVLETLLFSFSGGVVTLTSSALGAVCPGKEVTFTCIVTEGFFLEWSSTAFNPDIRYTQSTMRGETQRGIFTATLISVVSSSGSSSDFTSTLRVTVTQEAMLNGTVITCTDLLNPMNTTLTLAGPPSPPLSITPSNKLYGCSNVSIQLQWDPPPVDSGGTAVDNYTITVTGTAIQELISNGTTATITVVYNEIYTVNIRARNCAGSSGRATASIFEAGCGEPGTPINGSLLQFESAEVGAQVTYQCNIGFVPAVPQVSTCAQNRTWTPDPAQLVCQEQPQTRVICGTPNPPLGGFIDRILTDASNGTDVVFYQCNPGLLPEGELRAVCASNGSWYPDPMDLICRERVSCNAPDPPTNGSVEPYNNTVVGSEIFYQCDQGFVPKGRMRAVCEGSLSWSPNPADLVCSRAAAGGESVQCSTSIAISVVVSSVVSLITGAVIGAVVHYCAVRKKSECQKFYSLTVGRKQQKQQPAPVYEDIAAQSQNIELKENIAYGPIQQ